MISVLQALKKRFGGEEPPAGPSRECRLTEAYLGCECLYIPAGTKQKDVRQLFAEAESQCAGTGTVPVLISVNNNLAETLFDNAGIQYPEGDTVTEADRRKIAEFRDRLISQCSDSDAEEFFRAGEERVAQELAEEQFPREMWEGETVCFDDVIPEMGAFVDLGTLKSGELLLAKIPADEPWHISAWLPTGGWNECPAPKEMLAVAKRWYEKYRAVICCVTSSELEFRVSAPPADKTDAMTLAKEFYFFCEDRLHQYGSENSIATIAAGVTHSPFWYFWWD